MARGAPASARATDAATAYLELAAAVRAGLGPVDPYFTRLADAMVTWIEAWRQLNPGWPEVGGGADATPTAKAAAPPAASAGDASDTAVVADGGVTVTAAAAGATAKPADDSDAVASPGAGRRVKRRAGAA